MILKTIACEGKVLEPWVLMDEIDVVDLESGIKKSGTFHFICRECDALYFQDYDCLMIPQIKCLRKLH